MAEALNAPHASVEKVVAIAELVRESCWSIFRLGAPTPFGLCLMIMLNKAGHAALLNGSLRTTDPDPCFCAKAGEPVSAGYFWGVYAPGEAVLGIPLIARLLQAPELESADLFGRAVTEAGRRLMLSVGFRLMGTKTPGLYRYVRLSNRTHHVPEQLTNRNF